MTSIPGVSHVTAAGLLTQMPELGRLDAKAVASLAGLAPVTRQSGAWQGRSFIQGGRARARRLLYMPPWRRSVTTRTCARSTVSSSRRESRGRSRWSPSCASSSCWPTHCSNRTAAGSPNGPGGTARRSSRHDRCLRGGRGPGVGYARGCETVKLTHGYCARRACDQVASLRVEGVSMSATARVTGHARHTIARCSSGPRQRRSAATSGCCATSQSLSCG